MRVFHGLAPALLVCLLAACGEKRATPGAPSPQVLLDKLLGGLEDLEWQQVASCFDMSTDEGRAVAELSGSAIDLLQRARVLENAVRERFGDDYAAEHMVVPGKSLLLERLRERIRSASLRVEGEVARLHVDGAEPAKMLERYGRWYLACPAPFAGDGELQERLSRILELFVGHVGRATEALRTARTGALFEERMAELGRETRAACDPLLTAVIEGFRRRGLIRD